MTEQLDGGRVEQPDWLEVGQEAAAVVFANRRAVLDRGVVIDERLQVDALDVRENVPADQPPDWSRVGARSRGERPARVADASRRPVAGCPVTAGLRGLGHRRAGEPQGQRGRGGRHQSHEGRTAHEQELSG